MTADATASAIEQPVERPSWPADGGEMGALIRAHDWAGTPLGPVADWPQSLQTIIETLLASGLPAIALWGPRLIQIYNDGYRQLMGMKHPAGLGQPTRDCWPEVWYINEPIYERVLAGETLTFEDKLYPITRYGDLEDAWFTLSYNPLRDDSSAIAGVLVTVVETTARVVADRVLQESEARQAFLLRLSDALRPLTDPVAIEDTVTSAVGAFLGLSRAFYVTLTPDEATAVVHRDFAAGVPSMAGSYPVADYPLSVEELRAGRPVVINDVREDSRFGADETARLVALAQVALVSIPIVKHGAWVGSLTVGYDAPHAWTPDEAALLAEIAERTWAAVERGKAEAALRESEARYRTLFSSLNIGFCTIRVIFNEAQKPVDYEFLDVNPAFAAQTGLVDAVGKRVREMVPEHEAHWFEIYGRIALTGHPAQFENQAAALGRWYSVDAFRIGPPEHHEVGVLFEDITERKRAEEERQTFVDAAAHDLRTPLTSLKGRTQLLRQRARRGHLADADALIPGLEAIETQANRMAALIDEMLDAAHLQTGQLLDLNRFPTDLVALAETVAAETRVTTTRHTIQVVVAAPQVVGQWDELRLRRVIANVLNNAVKYSPGGGEVVVRVGCEEDAAGAWATMAVSDQGVGIPEADLPHLFERFHRGRNTSRIRGTGIGLAGASRIVQQHGGTIEVASVEGQGSTFTVRLPLQTG